MLVKQILSLARKRLVTVAVEAPLIVAAALLRDSGSDLLVVCDQAGCLAGVLTKTDIVRQISHCCGASCTEAIAEAMTRDVLCCEPDTELQDIWPTMKERGLKNIPIVDAGTRPLGILNAHDALELLLSEAKQQDVLLRDYVACSGYH